MASATRLEALYVELDVLLDTRLGTLAKIAGKEVVKTVLESGYHSRKSDCFAGVDKDHYLTQYKQRDGEILALSTVTNAITFVKHLVGVLTEQAIVRPYHDGAKLIVNYFPYELTGEERDELGKALAVWTNNLAPIELVYLHPKDLTPDHCKKSYSLMIVYEYEQWLNTHASAFEHCRLPEVTMYAPAIYFGPEPKAEELEKATREAAHPLRAMEMLASPLVNLQLIDVKYFSILSESPDNRAGIFAQPDQAAAQADA